MKITRVNLIKDDYEIWCARGSQWGNPFLIGKDGTREEVIAKYRAWLLTQPYLMDQLPLLKGKKLGCFCSLDLPCHVDVIVEFAENATPPRRIIEIGCGNKIDVGQA